MVVMSVGGVAGREKSILSWYFGIIDFTNLTRMNLLEGGGQVGSDMSRMTEKWRGRRCIGVGWRDQFVQT